MVFLIFKIGRVLFIEYQFSIPFSRNAIENMEILKEKLYISTLAA